MKRTTKLAIGFSLLVLLMSAGYASCADYVGVEKDQEPLEYIFKVKATGNEASTTFTVGILSITENASNSSVKLNITNESGKEFTPTIFVMENASFYNVEQLTENATKDNVIPQNFSYWVINVNAQKEYIYEDKSIDEKLVIKYDDNGMLKSLEMDTKYMDERFEVDISQPSSGGIPGYPALVFGISMAIGVALLIAKIYRKRT